MEELRARYMSRDDLDMKRHRSGEKKTVEKKRIFSSSSQYGSHNLTVNEKKEKKDAKIFFLYHRSIFVSFLVNIATFLTCN